MEYKWELDALNAIVKEQRRTNELLEQLLEQQNQQRTEQQDKPQTRGKRNVNKPT